MKDIFYSYQIALVETLKITNSLALSLREKGLNIQQKNDKTVLTNADLAVNVIIMDTLAKISDYQIVSEEMSNFGFDNPETFWLIDPIDGSAPYSSGSANFATCIALIHSGKPVFGMISIPSESIIYTGINLPDYKECFSTIYAENKTISSSILPPPEHIDIITILSGKTIDPELKKMLPIREIVRPSAVKFCMLASREADAYIRINAKQMDWDIAAGQAIAEASGFICSTPTGEPITYPNPEFSCPSFLISSPYWYDELKETILLYLHHH